MKEILLLDGNTDMRLARILIQLLLARTLRIAAAQSLNSADFGERIEVRAIKYLFRKFQVYPYPFLSCGRIKNKPICAFQTL